MRSLSAVVGLSALLALSACGDTDFERGVTGAAIGAGVGKVVFNDPVTGAAIGAGVGVISDDID